MPETDRIWEELKALRANAQAQHERLRADMTAGFDRIRYEVVTKQEQRLREHGDRLLVIETEREAEARHVAKVGTIAGILGGIGVSTLFRMAEKWFSR